MYKRKFMRRHTCSLIMHLFWLLNMNSCLMQFQYTPKHLVRLLQIIVDGTYDMGVRQVASIHFKNFVAKHWSPHDPGRSGVPVYVIT